MPLTEPTGVYGHPSVIYARVGRVWAALLGLPEIDAETVCLMLSGMKLARQTIKPKDDNLVDAAGYVECAAMCRERASRCSLPLP